MAGNSVDNIDMADDRPIAVRRKRRLSSSLVDHVVPAEHGSMSQIAHGDTAHLLTGRTPSKPKKKVRFSDPGPDTSTAVSSSGLTPHLRRTSFDPRARDARDSSPPRLRPQAPRRRLSLPSLTTALPSPSLSPPPLSLSGEMQYAPLRQILDGRVKRRLRRNGLSEEMNGYQAEKKSRTQWIHEIESLKRELALVRDGQNGEHPGADVTSSRRIQQLEEELVQLKQERAQTPIIESFPADSILRDESGIFIDDTAQDFVEDHFSGAGGLKDVTPVAVTPTMKETAAQVSTPHPAEQEMLRKARLSLEYLFPGEIALGLLPEDPMPLFDVILERLQTLKTQLLVTEDALSTTETQESNLRTQFNAVLEQLDRARKYSEKLSQKHASEVARADAAQARIPLMEISAKDASEKAEGLQKEMQDKDRSFKKLQSSLDSYRVEVSKLEDLINSQEEEHNKAIASVRAEMDEAVAAETLGRQEAEQEVVERDAKITQLQHREKELVATVNEKQGIIREMESTLAQSHEHEHEIGHLNVQISTLSSNFHDAVEQRTRAENARDVLMRRLEDEKNAGLRAIDALRAELAQFSRNTDGIKAAYASDSQRRGKEVAEHKGLLTPVAETRFRDIQIPGYVETRRGKGKRKQRPDSGIGILEEEDEGEGDDEDMDFVGLF